MLWLAPEMFKAINNGQTVQKSTATDVFAYGLVLYEIITGCQPYYDNDLPLDLLRLQVPMGLQPGFGEWQEAGSELGQRLIGLMKACWQVDALQRPFIAEVCKELQQLMTAAAAETM
jgi:hypothetical protein